MVFNLRIIMLQIRWVTSRWTAASRLIKPIDKTTWPCASQTVSALPPQGACGRCPLCGLLGVPSIAGFFFFFLLLRS